MESYHEPVLLWEVLGSLKVEPGKWYIDATLGDGGHSLEILKLGGKVVGLDVDPQALERARERLQGAGYSEQDFILVQGNFNNLKELLQMDLADQKFAGVLFDLGVSSLQLESPERGFSFSKSGPLDMRMNPNLGVSAMDLVNALNKGELYELFTKLGEEKRSRAIVDALVSSRPLKTTDQLARVIERVVGRKSGKIHPATKVFQALRIAVNDELNSLREALPQALEILQKDGFILVISFHSLEDRIVKTCFREWESSGLGEVLTKKPIEPSEEEILVNPRSRSAKLRVFKVL